MTRLTLLVGCVLVFGNHPASAASLIPLLRAAGMSAVSKPTKAPDFQLADVTGQLHHLSAQRGKVVLVNFWATWCPPCRLEMPLLEQLSQALHQQSFVLWAINSHESQEQVTRFMTTHRLHFPALLDPNGKVSRQYAVHSLPTTYLMDCQEGIVGMVIGPRDWTGDAMRTLLAAMMHDGACQHSSTPPQSTSSAEGS